MRGLFIFPALSALGRLRGHLLALVVVGIRGSNPMIKLKNAEVNISVMAFRCKSDLRVAIERQAAAEGISASDCDPARHDP